MPEQIASAIKITIVIPMRNERQFVRGCLDSILGQIAGRSDVEVLCVDGASTDGTREIAAEYAKNDSRFLVLDNPRKIVPTGMNIAVRHMRGEVLIRLDCHCEYAPDYVEKCVESLYRTGADIIGGIMETRPGVDSPTGRAIAAATSSRFGVGGSVFRTGGQEQEVDALPFGCFRRDVFERFGMFDERLVRNQDVDLYGRVRKGGGKVMVSPSIRLTYFNRSTYSGLRQQSFTNGLWNLYSLYLSRSGLSLRHFVPLGFVCSILLLAAAGFLWWPFWLALAAEIAVYFAVATAAAKQAAKGRAKIFRVLLAFVQLHVVYGLGSLWGMLTVLFKFGLRPAEATGEALEDRRQ